MIHRNFSRMIPAWIEDKNYVLGGSLPILEYSTENSINESDDYVNFLQTKQRKYGCEGYFDSKKYQMLMSGYRVLDDNVTKKYSNCIRKRHSGKEEHKEAEEPMWVIKQDERELKRYEGDIIKKQSALKHSLRDFEWKNSESFLNEGKKLETNLHKYTKLQHSYVHDSAKDRIHQINKRSFDMQMVNDADRKQYFSKSDLSRKLSTKLSEYQLQKSQLDNLKNNFQRQIFLKEENIYKLKKEIKENELAVDMEIKKNKKQMNEMKMSIADENHSYVVNSDEKQSNLQKKLGNSDADIKASHMLKETLNAELLSKLDDNSLKQREEYRKLKDTRLGLERNMNNQKRLVELAFQDKMDTKLKNMQKDMKDHVSKKRELLNRTNMNKKIQNKNKTEMLLDKFNVRSKEEKMRRHEDNINLYTKLNTKAAGKEQVLYNNFRNVEFDKRKQDNAVKKLKNERIEMKKKNQKTLLETIREINEKEIKLDKKISEACMDFDKLHARKECVLSDLLKHKGGRNETKYLLNCHQKERIRDENINA